MIFNTEVKYLFHFMQLSSLIYRDMAGLKSVLEIGWSSPSELICTSSTTIIGCPSRNASPARIPIGHFNH